MNHQSCLPLFFDNLEEFRINNFFQTETLPGVNMSETADDILVEVPVPGCTEDQIQITYERGALLVSAQEIEEKKEDRKYLLRSERAYSYRIPLPSRIDEQSQPEASYEHGVLKVKFPKSKANRPMKIALKK
ncbi:MAG TPA: Hsp20/alpha crystallin family protein [Chlamydiales bacterium]|jgi:HSP20 family protein